MQGLHTARRLREDSFSVICEELLNTQEARVELARAQGPLDFESSASTSFTTPASERDDYSDAWFAVSMLIGIEQRAWSRG